MTTAIKTVIYPVTDLAQAKGVFGALLGVAPYMDEPYYVGFRAADQDIGLDPHGHRKGMTAPVCYWHVDDIHARLAQLLEAGAQAHQPITDVGGGKLIGAVKDADGNIIGLLQPA